MGLHSKLKVFLTIFFFFQLMQVRGQGPFTEGNHLVNKGAVQYFSEKWTVENGLPVNNINQIYQTPNGYLWLATNIGLIRFDGVNFHLFEVGNTPEFPSNRFSSLMPGQKNSFWLATQQNHLIYVDGDQRFVFQDIDNSQISDVVLDGDSITWVIANAKLMRFDEEEMQLLPFLPEKLGQNQVKHLLRAADGSLLIQVTDQNRILKTWHPYENWDTLAVGNPATVEKLMEDRHHMVWMTGDKVQYFEEGQILDVPYGKAVYQGWTNVSAFFQSMMEDQEGNIWAKTENGLYKVKQDGLEVIEKVPSSIAPLINAWRNAYMSKCPDGSVWKILKNNVYRNGHLQFSTEEAGSCLYCDLNNNIWIGQYRSGLYRYSNTALETIVFAGSDNNIYGVYADRMGRVWFNEWYGDVKFLDKDQNIQVVPFSHENGSSASFLESSDGAFHIGMMRCPPEKRLKNGDCVEYERLPGLHDNVFAIFETKDGSVWLGDREGLHLYKNGQISFVPMGKNNGSNFGVRYLLEDRKENLWMATNGGGVGRYHYPSGEVRFFNVQTGLSSDNIRWLMEDEEGYIWIATEDKGLNRLDPETGAAEHVRTTDGLYSDGLHALLLDDFNRLWMSTNTGIFWVEFTDLQNFILKKTARLNSTVYTERDGMLNREANGGFQNAALKTGDGRLWFSTQYGLVTLDPKEITERQSVKPVVIEQVFASGLPLKVENMTIMLEPDQNNFSIQYTSPFFNAPKNLRFRYMLEGFDKAWVENENKREAVYTNLPHGAYTFKVAAYMGEGLEEQVITALKVIKLPHFYETAWFKALVFLSLVLMVVGGYKWRVRKLKSEQRSLEVLVATRTKDLAEEKLVNELQNKKLIQLDKEKNKVFANISHEFKTPLTLILGPLTELKQDSELQLSSGSREKVEMATRNTKRLIRLVEQLMDLSKLEAKELQLNMKAMPMNGYLLDIALSFQGIADKKQIDFKVEVPDYPVCMSFDPDQFDKIIANLLSNAFKFTPQHGCIHVRLEAKGDLAIISVRDTGIGIGEEHLPRLFDRFYQIEKSELQPGSGIGLSLTKELTELHQGLIHVSSEPGAGTVFELSFPLANVPVILPEEIHPAVEEVSSSRSQDLQQYDPEDENMADWDEDRTTILVVDDNQDIRNYLSSHLHSKYRIIQAISGNQAMEKIKQRVPDVVITDVMMPDGDGIGLLKHIREDQDLNFLPVILLTAKAEVEDRLMALRIGADAFIPKPFQMEEIWVILQNLLDQQKRLRSHFAQLDPKGNTRLLRLSLEDQNIKSSDQLYLDQLVQVIGNHLSNEAFSIEMLAEKMNQSRSNLYRKVFQLTGETPSDCLKRLRLERSAVLLSAKAGTVSEVAYSCGFKSISHFSKIFREKYGQSPTAYAQLSLEK